MTPDTRAYHPLFGPLIVGELVLNAVLLLWALGLLYFFFAKGRHWLLGASRGAVSKNGRFRQGARSVPKGAR